MSKLVRRAATLAVQESLEAEQRDSIGRDRYERRPASGLPERLSHRASGLAEGRLKVVAQLSDAGAPYCSKRSPSLRKTPTSWGGWQWRCTPGGCRLGTSRQPFTGPVLSRTAVSDVTECLWQPHEAFQQRDLSEIPLLYLFLDGIYQPIRRHGIQHEAVLCAWEMTTEGEKVLLSSP